MYYAFLVQVIKAEHNEHILGIRDTETVQEFQRRLQNARRIVVIGNGGIATEIVWVSVVLCARMLSI